MPPKDRDVSLNNVESFVSRLCRLDVGKSEARVERIACDEATKDTLMSTIESLRNSIATSVSQAAKRTGQKYTVESGDIRTKSFDFIIVVCVSRTA